MKAKDYNGTIKIYSRLPKSYGSIIGGFDLLSDSELQSHGFYDVVKPSYNSDTQELGAIYWDSANSQFTYPVNNKTWSETLAELKEQKISNLKTFGRFNSKLAETDWIIVRDTELGNTTDQDTLDDRAALRTVCSTHETAINAKTTKAQVASYALPDLT